jgi:hypothetical protein
MCISEMTSTPHTSDTKDNTGNTQDGERDQKAHAPFPVLSFVDWVAGEDRESPYYAQNKI